MLKTKKFRSLYFQLKGLKESILNPDSFFYKITAIEEQFITLCLKEGDKHYALLSGSEEPETKPDEKVLSALHFCFFAADDIVEYLAAWQQSFFEMQKAHLFFLDGKSDTNNLESFFVESLTFLEKTLTELEPKLHFLNNDESNKQELIKQIKLQNPWKVYRKQILNLYEQSLYTLRKFRLMFNASHTFNTIRGLLRESVSASEMELKELDKIVADILDHIRIDKNKRPDEQIQDLSEYLENVETVIRFTGHVENFNSRLENETDKLEGQSEFAFKAQSGRLYTREINFKNRLRNWLNREVQPFLSELWEIVEVNSNGLKMALQNMTIILKNTDETSHPDEFSALVADMNDFIRPFSKNIMQGKEFFSELKEKINTRVNLDLQLSLIFDETRFFLSSAAEQEIPGENGGRQFFHKIKEYSLKLIEKYRLAGNQLKSEQLFGYKEKIVRFIRDREISNANSQYNNFFITKGYYGDTFLVAREREYMQTRQVIENWKKGYRGSVLISGHRLSGRTMFGESIATEFFSDNTLRISPKQEIQKGGSSHRANYDMKSTLNYLAGHYMNDKACIWIDDLELWWDVEYTLAANIRALASFIDRYSDKFFIMVSINLAVRDYIQDFMAFGKTFQSQVYISPMKLKDTEKAIKIRHIAAQKVMLGRKRQSQAGNAEMRSFIRKIHQISKGNIGYALSLWASYVDKAGDKEVRFTYQSRYRLPDFINMDNGLILSQIFLQKRTTEYRMRRMFGPAFNGKYADMLKRMLGMGVLSRNFDGWIELNEHILAELAELLHKHNYINYRYSGETENGN